MRQHQFQAFGKYGFQAFKMLGFVVTVLASSLLLSGCSFTEIKQKSGLQVMTNDIPSSLFLDGQYLEKTPYINKEIQPGTYTLRIQPDDPTYQPFDTSVTLRKGLLSVVIWKPGKRPELSGGVVYEMEKLSNNKATELAIRTIPDGAIVSINDGAKEFSPLTKTELPAGEHKYQVSLPSYETQQHTVNLVAGHRVSVFVKLAKTATETEIPASTTTLPSSTTSAIPTATSPSPKAAPVTTTPTPPPASPSATAVAQPPITGPKVTINSTNFFANGQESLRVRSASSSASTELGFAPVGSSYPYLNETANGFNKITFQNKTGWVSTQFSTVSP